jgi:quercetin dioxygenase-like cupin family protein
MKKSIPAYICLVAVAILFTACGSTPAAQTTSSALLHNEAQQNAATSAATGQGCQQAQTATPTATPRAQAKAQHSTEKTLATGQVSTLPQGNLFANILSASQPAGSSVTHKHVASFVYEVSGTKTLQRQGGPKQTLNSGDAAFIQSDGAYTHANPGSTTNQWYLIALRPTTVAAPTPSLPDQKTVYETPTLPTTVFSKGAYCESLLRTEQQPHGKTASQRYSGLELLHVLDGSVKVDVAGQDTKTVKAGESTYVLPNTPVQVSNAGTGVARFLSFNAWPQGQPLREDLAGLPGEVGTPVPTAAATGTATPAGTATETATPVGTATPTTTPTV